MSLLPPTSTFAERVEVLFAVVRGRGLALGVLDRELLGRWSEQGVPLEVVARGLLRAAERARWNGSAGAAPRALRACGPARGAPVERGEVQPPRARGARRRER